ncbi:HlyD family secretion protein [Laceyella putida]|uniref:HlyD family secretion protein n=1 Tax=Laceyella putida TaxID=110101 RepID=A0ABW2RGV2_9BACL
MKRVLIGVITLVFILAAVGGGAYYIQQHSQYVITDNAQVKADVIPIVPMAVGKLTEWSVHTGDRVEQGAPLGVEEVASGNPSPTNGAKAQTPNVVTTPITSPIAGTVLMTHAVPGQVVAAGQPIAVLADLSKTYVLAYVDEAEMGDIHKGQQVDVQLASDMDRVITGRIAEVGLTAGTVLSGTSKQAATGNDKEVQRVPVKITVGEDETNKLIPGMNAMIKIHRS